MKPTNIVLEQNRRSKFLNQVLEKYPVEKLHNNEIGKIYPNNFRSFDYIPPSVPFDAIPTSGSKFNFKINETEGFLSDMFLKVSLTCAGDNTGMNEKVYYNLFKDIYIKQGEFQIARINPAYIISRISEMPSNVQENYNSIITGDADFDTSTVNFYIPLFCFFTDEEKNNLFLNFHKQISVDATWNNITWNSALTGCSVKLGIIRSNYEKSYLNALVKEREMNKRYYLSYDIIPYAIPISDSDTSVSVELKSNYLVSAIHVCGIQSDWDMIDIQSIQLDVNGNTMIDMNRSEMVFYRRPEDRMIPALGTTEFSYHFGSRNDFKGHLSLLNVSNLLTINFGTHPSAGTIWVILETRNVIDSDSYGQMSSSLTI